MNQKYSQIFELIEKAGRQLKKHHGKIDILGHKNDIHDASVLTKLDLETEHTITNRLLKLFPNIGIYGEEYGQQGNKNRYFTIDPIDGTAHFVRGLPFSTCMVALIEDNRVIFSLIYDYLNNDFYWAEAGLGARKNRSRIHVSDRPINRSYISFEKNINIKGSLEKYILMDKLCVLFHSINCGWEFAMVASGKLDGRIAFNSYTKLWDQAPGSLLVAEAGGIVRNIGSDTYDVTNLNIIATNNQIYDSLTEGKNAVFPVKNK